MRRWPLVLLAVPVLYVAIFGVARANEEIAAHRSDRCAPVSASYVGDPEGSYVADPVRPARTIAVGAVSFRIEADVYADYGAYVRPVPMPFGESHYANISLVVSGGPLRPTCVQVVTNDEILERAAVALEAAAGSDATRYVIDGHFPAWRLSSFVALMVFAELDGRSYAFAIAPLLVKGMG